jgi:ATP-binding cassette, subfamily B, bacterial HlyB/CyaB
MIYTPSAIQEFISRVEPWAKLPPEAQAELAQKLQPLRYRIGQVVAVKGKILNSIAIVYEGKVRLLGYEPQNQAPVTLEFLEPGDIIGGINLLRGISCETAIASTESTCLVLSNQEFIELLQKYTQFQEAFRYQCFLLEVYELLGSYFARQPQQAEGNLKDIAQQAFSKAIVFYLPAGKYPINQLDSNRVWLVSSGEITNYPQDSFLNLSDPNPIEVKGAIPARLIGVPVDKLSAPVGQKLRAFEENNALESEVLNEEESKNKIPYAEESEWVDESKQSSPLNGTQKRITRGNQTKYPFFRGRSKLEAGVACFQMLSKYFGMPFRKEVIRRIIEDQLKRHDRISLPFCGAVVELMGLSAQLITVPDKALGRLNAPALVEWQDSLAILYEISERQIVIAVPEMGILKRQTADFLETWGENVETPQGTGRVGQVLLLQPTKETPEERFSWRWFLPALSEYQGVLLLVLISSFFVQLFALANPLMVQLIIDVVIVQDSADTLQVLGVLLIVLAFFEAILGALRTYLFVDTTNRIDISLGTEIIDHLLRLPLRYFERRPVGEISTRINELENIRQFLTGTALTAVLDAVFSVVYVVVMVIYSPILTLWALGVVPLLFILTLIFSPIIRRQLRTKAERNSQTQSQLVEVMTGIQTVKAQNIELRSRWQWQERYSRYVSAGFQTVITSTLSSSASNFLNKLSGLLVLWVGAHLVLEGDLSLGQLIAFRIIASYVTSPILRLGQLWQNFQETALSLERLSDIVDTPQEAEEDRNNIPMPAIRGAVKYENVSFRFKSGGPLQLNNVSLEFPAGIFVGIVGQSGAGKSTLTKLISRLYEPEAGRILIDGYDISKVELYSLRRQIGVVPQETLLFDGTVQENIALTTPEATTEEIISAAQVAAAHEFIMNLPNGYNTRVGERGASLSGGQRQRIAIARSVLQQPEILVLDEATSALDYATEQQVCRNLAQSFRNKSVFFITHRLGTVKQADIIVMMHEGSVVEQGSHEQLMALRGRYYSLYQQQEGITSNI